MATITANKTGRPSVVILKALPRICSRNSRLATSHILRMVLAPDGADEDLFERWLDHLKTVDRGHRCGFVQQLLRVSSGLQMNFGAPGKIFCFRHFIALEKCRVALELHDHVIPLVPFLDLADPAAQHRLSIIDKAD